MGDSLETVSAGSLSPFVRSSRTINDTLKLLREYNTLRPSGSSHPGAGLDQITPALSIFVKNNTTETLPPFSVVKLGAPTIDIRETELRSELRLRPIVLATAPDAATNPFAITIEGCGPNDVCRAVISGLMVVDVQVVVATDAFAAPAVADSTKLVSAASGPALILHKETGTGTKKALVLLGLGGGGGGGSVAVAAHGQAELGSTYVLTVDNTWQATGLSLSLPSAGTYFIFGRLRVSGQLGAIVGNAFIYTRLYDATAGVALPDTYHIAMLLTDPDMSVQTASGSVCTVYTASSAASIQVHLQRNSGPTWTSSVLNGAAVPPEGSHIGYLKIG